MNILATLQNKSVNPTLSRSSSMLWPRSLSLIVPAPVQVLVLLLASPNKMEEVALDISGGFRALCNRLGVG